MHALTKALVLSTLALSSATAGAQRNEPFRIGLEAGYTFNTYNSSHRDVNIGGLFGVRAEYDLPKLKRAYVAGGARFIMRGADTPSKPQDRDWYRAGYIEVPLAMGVYWQAGRRVGLFAETGPYFAYGIGGRIDDSSLAGYWFSSDSNDRFFSAANNHPRRFDVGWGGQAGFAFKHFRFSLGYEQGLIPVWSSGQTPDLPHTAKYRNSSVVMGFSYLFY